jgi:hypothetical protein
MKRFSSMILAAMVVVMAAVVLVASATPAAAKTNGAIVTRLADGCSISVDQWFVIGYLQDVQTPSGNEKFTCTGQVAAGTEPSSAVVVQGTCTGYSGSGTADIRITPSGNAIATCQIKK